MGYYLEFDFCSSNSLCKTWGTKLHVPNIDVTSVTDIKCGRIRNKFVSSRIISIDKHAVR